MPLHTIYLENMNYYGEWIILKRNKFYVQNEHWEKNCWLSRFFCWSFGTVKGVIKENRNMEIEIEE